MPLPDPAFSQVILACLAALFAAYGLIQRHRADKFGREVAKHQGVFETPDIRIDPYGIEDEVSDNFILAVPFSKGEVFELPFAFHVRNIGAKTAEDVEIVFRINKYFLMPAKAAEICWTFEGTTKEVKTARAQDSGPFITLTIALDTLHPSQKSQIQGVFVIGAATIKKQETNVTFKDGQKGVVHYWYHLTTPLDVVVFQRDRKAVSRRLEIQIINSAGKTARDSIGEYAAALAKRNSEHISGLRWHQRVRERIRQGREWKKVTLLSVDGAETRVVLKKTSPGGMIKVRLADRASICHGVAYPGGYWFPAFEGRASFPASRAASKNPAPR